MGFLLLCSVRQCNLFSFSTLLVHKMRHLFRSEWPFITTTTTTNLTGQELYVVINIMCIAGQTVSMNVRPACPSLLPGLQVCLTLAGCCPALEELELALNEITPAGERTMMGWHMAGWTGTHADKLTHTHARAHTHTHARAHTHTHAHTTHTHTHTHTQHTHIHTRTRTHNTQTHLIRTRKHPPHPPTRRHSHMPSHTLLLRLAPCL